MQVRCVRIIVAMSLMVLLFGLGSCYQVHSGDELREVSVTNNPNIVPNTGGMGRFTAMHP